MKEKQHKLRNYRLELIAALVLVCSTGIVISAARMWTSITILLSIVEAGVILLAVYKLRRLRKIAKNIVYEAGEEEYREAEKALNSALFKIKQNMGREYTAQILKTQAEMHSLQSQINPHFLYNTLETIRSQALIYNVPDVAEMTENMAALFRYSISRPGEMASIQMELENAERYLLLQQYRFRGKYTVVKKLEDSPVFMQCMIPVLTLQPVIENAIHHGLEPQIEAGKITIRGFSTEKSIILIISDDGVGMDEAELGRLREHLKDTESAGIGNRSKKEKSGIALINVNQRLKFYFGEEYGLYVDSTKGNGTSVEVRIPMVKQV